MEQYKGLCLNSPQPVIFRTQYFQQVNRTQFNEATETKSKENWDFSIDILMSLHELGLSEIFVFANIEELLKQTNLNHLQK